MQTRWVLFVRSHVHGPFSVPRCQRTKRLAHVSACRGPIAERVCRALGERAAPVGDFACRDVSCIDRLSVVVGVSVCSLLAACPTYDSLICGGESPCSCSYSCCLRSRTLIQTLVLLLGVGPCSDGRNGTGKCTWYEPAGLLLARVLHSCHQRVWCGVMRSAPLCSAPPGTLEMTAPSRTSTT